MGFLSEQRSELVEDLLVPSVVFEVDFGLDFGVIDDDRPERLLSLGSVECSTVVFDVLVAIREVGWEFERLGGNSRGWVGIREVGWQLERLGGN